jgi:hypothetical protein
MKKKNLRTNKIKKYLKNNKNLEKKKFKKILEKKLSKKKNFDQKNTKNFSLKILHKYTYFL